MEVGGRAARRWPAWRSACALTLLCAALERCGAAGALKRADMFPVPYVLGPRYGRSLPDPLPPRMDRSALFLLHFRYGKRSVGTGGDMREPRGEGGTGEAGGTSAASGEGGGGGGGWGWAREAGGASSEPFFSRRAGGPERVPAED